MNYIYLSAKGSDKASGTKDTPVATLERARELARAADGETTVVIEAGRYFRDRTFELDARDSGTHYVADGEVYFDGGIIIDPADVKDYRDSIKVVDLEKYGIELHGYGNRGFRRSYSCSQNELFIGSDAYSVARYPKKGLIYYEEGDIIEKGSMPRNGDFECKPATVRIRDERIKNWAGEAHAYLAGYPQASFADECVKIAKIDADKGEITTTQPHLYGYHFTHHSGYYILNVLSELTDEGEYYLDVENKKLYFIPKADMKPDALIQLSAMGEVMVAIENAENVSLEGIVFENTRSSGVYVEGGEGVRIADCTFRNLGILAVQIGQGASKLEHGLHSYHGEHAEGTPPFVPVSREMGNWGEYIYEFAAWNDNAGKNHAVEGCKVYQTGAGGISMGGGDRKTLTPAGNRIHNCEIFRVNRLDRTYRPGINMMGVGNTISHCKLYDMPSMAINLHGNDHVIEFNEIFDVTNETSDAGAIYMGRDMSEVGNIFRNNYIHDIINPIDTALGVCAIYFDDWDIFNEVCDNFFVNIQGGGFGIIHHTCGGCLSFHNNFVIDCIPGVNPNKMSNSYIKMHRDELAMKRVRTADIHNIGGVDITSKVYRDKYPYLYDVYMNDTNYDGLYYNNVIRYNRYDIFVDGANRDFTQNEKYAGPPVRDEYDHLRRFDPVAGYYNDLVMPHKVEFKSIGLIKK